MPNRPRLMKYPATTGRDTTSPPDNELALVNLTFLKILNLVALKTSCPSDTIRQGSQGHFDGEETQGGSTF
jgi:hypothetical protein